jgi:hypothetical protein
MKNQRLIIIVSSIIIGFILIGILVGFLIKSNNRGNNDNNGDIFKEIPFKYKLPTARMGDCPLINSKPSDTAPQCPIALNYSETAKQFGMWTVDPLTDKSQSMCISTDNGCLTNYSYVKPKWNWIIGTCKAFNRAAKGDGAVGVGQRDARAVLDHHRATISLRADGRDVGTQGGGPGAGAQRRQCVAGADSGIEHQVACAGAAQGISGRRCAVDRRAEGDGTHATVA